MPTYENQDGHTQQKNSQQPVDRIARAVNPLNTPVECEECGGTYFYTTYAEQFAGSGYGSVEFRSLSASPMPIRICLCGHPLVPKQTVMGGSQQVQSARQAFFVSAGAAIEKRKKLRPDNLLKVVAGTADLESLKNSLGNSLIGILERLSKLENLANSAEVSKEVSEPEAKEPELPQPTHSRIKKLQGK